MDKKKLQDIFIPNEIDCCINKVQEGVKNFDGILEKIHKAKEAKQKENLVADLKKEIEKLQELYEQIKGWKNSRKIKDKLPLEQCLHTISEKVEQWKKIEQEMKTKPCSNQGSVAEQQMSPSEKQKQDTILWLQDCISRLTQQIEVIKREVEQLHSVTAGKKKKLDKDKQDKLDEFNKKIELHTFLISKLELLLGLLANNDVEAPKIRGINDNVGYYIGHNHETNFEENQMLYDALLDEIAVVEQQLSPGGLEQSGNSDSDSNSDAIAPAQELNLGGLRENDNSDSTLVAIAPPLANLTRPDGSLQADNKDSDDSVTKTNPTRGGEEIMNPICADTSSMPTKSSSEFSRKGSTDSGLMSGINSRPPSPYISDKSDDVGNRPISSATNAISWSSSKAVGPSIMQDSTATKAANVLSSNVESPNPSQPRVTKLITRARYESGGETRVEEVLKARKPYVGRTSLQEPLSPPVRPTCTLEFALPFLDFLVEVKKFKSSLLDSAPNTASVQQWYRQYIIPNDDFGKTYDRIFDQFLTKDVRLVEIDDPYTCNTGELHQCQLFIQFCECVRKLAPNTKLILHKTYGDPNTSFPQNLLLLKHSLKDDNIELDVIFDRNLHAREIRLDSKWVIKIDRGLDYFKPQNWQAKGIFDEKYYCKQTKVDVIYNPKPGL